jgi:hypothetical protein
VQESDQMNFQRIIHGSDQKLLNGHSWEYYLEEFLYSLEKRIYHSSKKKSNRKTLID